MGTPCADAFPIESVLRALRAAAPGASACAGGFTGACRIAFDDAALGEVAVMIEAVLPPLHWESPGVARIEVVDHTHNALVFPRREQAEAAAAGLRPRLEKTLLLGLFSHYGLRFAPSRLLAPEIFRPHVSESAGRRESSP